MRNKLSVKPPLRSGSVPSRTIARKHVKSDVPNAKPSKTYPKRALWRGDVVETRVPSRPIARKHVKYDVPDAKPSKTYPKRAFWRGDVVKTRVPSRTIA